MTLVLGRQAILCQVCETQFKLPCTWKDTVWDILMITGEFFSDFVEHEVSIGRDSVPSHIAMSSTSKNPTSGARL